MTFEPLSSNTQKSFKLLPLPEIWMKLNSGPEIKEIFSCSSDQIFARVIVGLK